VVEAHAAHDDGGLRLISTGSPPVVAIVGEIDELTYRGLLSALAEIGDGPGEIHFDLAGVQYCDLAGLRALVGMTRVGPGSTNGGRTVVLLKAPPHLRTILEILGWDSTPGLYLDERRTVGPKAGSLPQAGVRAGLDQPGHAGAAGTAGSAPGSSRAADIKPAT
jgi:anti-anti-sigma regulatory factor